MGKGLHRHFSKDDITTIPFLAIYQKELKARSWRDICTPMFITALYSIAKMWKQPKCPSMDETKCGI